MPITLNATQVPLPMTFSGATPVIGDVAPGTGPLTSEMMDSGEKVPFTTTKFNKHGLRQDLVSRYGAGFYFLADGGVLTAGAGLLLNVAFLHAGVDGTVEIAAQSIALTDATRNHIWAKRDGTLEARTDLTQPSQAAGYLGSALCAGGSISSVDESGVLYSRMGNPWRETADAGVPGDTPTADHAGMLTKTAGGVYLWDGTAYQLLAPTGGGGTIGVAVGGTGADMSAEGGAGFVVMQEGVGDPFTSRLLIGSDLPVLTAAKTTTYNIVAADHDTTFENQGGAVTFNLPTFAVGLRYRFVVRNAAGLTVDSPDTLIKVGSRTSINTGSIKSTDADAVIELVGHGGGNWVATAVVGAWGIEIATGIFDDGNDNRVYRYEDNSPINLSERWGASRTGTSTLTTGRSYAWRVWLDHDIDFRYLILSKSNATTGGNLQASLWGVSIETSTTPDRAIGQRAAARGARNNPWDLPTVLLAKSASTAEPGAAQNFKIDVGGAGRVRLYSAYEYWLVLSTDASVAGTYQIHNMKWELEGDAEIQPNRVYSDSAFTYASNFGTVGVTTMPTTPWTYGGQVIEPVLWIA